MKFQTLSIMSLDEVDRSNCPVCDGHLEWSIDGFIMTAYHCDRVYTADVYDKTNKMCRVITTHTLHYESESKC